MRLLFINKQFKTYQNIPKHTEKGQVISPLPFHAATYADPYQSPRTWFVLPPGSNASDAEADRA